MLQEFLKIFQLLADQTLKMSYLRKPHGLYTIIHNMCTSLSTLGGFTSTPRRHLEEDRVRARINSDTYPPRYEMKVVVQEFHKLHKPKINKLKGGYTATANFIFQSWLKDINIHFEDQNLTEREAIQLVKDFTAERACNEVEFYMGMTADDQKTFDGLVNHLKNAFQLGETMSELISDFYHCHQKRNELEDVFANDLQILVRKIIAWKPFFRAEANEQLKHQYAHKLHDQYYAAIAHSVLQTSNPMETFTPIPWSIGSYIW